jgi:hypothetical protein
MKRARRFGLIASVCCLFILTNSGIQPGPLAQTPAVPGTAQFSRSAWIARHAKDVPFSGGVLPSGVRSTNPWNESAVSGRHSVAQSDLTAAYIGITSAIQISSDLLPTDSAAQPATHAEPYIDASLSSPANLIGVWQENRFANGGARAIGYAASSDGGQSWSGGLIPNSTRAAGGTWERASDPWVAFGPGNKAYFVSLLFNESNPDSAVGVSVSSDGGLTWGDPVNVTFSDIDFSDKEAIVVDSFPNSPHLGNVYVAWDLNIPKARSVRQVLVVARSTDGGKTYQDPVVIRKKGGANLGAIPRVAPDGTVYVVWIGATPSNNTLFFISKSADGGQSWTHWRSITDVTVHGQQNIRDGGGLPSFSVDPVTGHLYVAWQDGRFGDVDQAALITSTDGGQTWSNPVRVNDGPTDAPAFTVSVAAGGNQVAVSYYSLQNDPQRKFLADEYVRISTDGGVTFGPSVRVTPNSFDMRMAAQAGNAAFLGDYAGLVPADSRFHLLWINSGIPSTVTGKPQPEALTSSTQ